jgi:hypothetical protein
MSPWGRLGWIMITPLLACDRPAPPRANDTITRPPTPPSTAIPRTTEAGPWNTELGPAFLVVSATSDQAAVILPTYDSSTELDTATIDARAVLSRRFDLFANGQSVGSVIAATAVDADVPDDCTSWPIVRVQDAGTWANRGWVVGVEQDRVVPFATDTLGGLSAADSASLTIEIARLASSAPHDTVAALRGTPFQVRRAYEIRDDRGERVVLAEVLRALNQEATPLQEHLLIIGTRDTVSGRLDLAYVERTSGTEDLLEASELLMAGRLIPSGVRFALVARYLADGVVYSLLEATSSGRWRNRWTSTYAGC